MIKEIWGIIGLIHHFKVKCNKSLQIIYTCFTAEFKFTHNHQYVIFNSSSKAFSNLLPISIYIKIFLWGSLPYYTYLGVGGGGGGVFLNKVYEFSNYVRLFRDKSVNY